jgi:ABC-type uncharacterized transport system ATPase subunit
MKDVVHILRNLISWLLLLTVLAYATTNVHASEKTQKKKQATEQKSDHSQTVVFKTPSSEAVVSVLSFKLAQQFYLIIRTFYFQKDEVILDNPYAVFLDTYFANIFSKSIVINAP